MPDAHERGQVRDEARLHIEAPPDRIYDLVSDITHMGRLSPECTGGRWLRGATGPAAGARFVGFNRRGWVRWFTTNRVVTAERGREFSFDTVQSGTRWIFSIEPDGDGSMVTERREPWRDRPLAARMTSRFLLGGTAEHEEELRDGLTATLERLKAVAEAEAR